MLVRARVARLAIPAGCLALLASCATSAVRHPPVAPGMDSERTLLDLQSQNAGYVRRIEELENRVFILEDQLDSQKLAAQQRGIPALPAASSATRTSGAAAAAQPPRVRSHASGAMAGESATGAPASLVDEPIVEYVGDAAVAADDDGAAPRARVAVRPVYSTAPSARPRLHLTAPEPIAESSLTLAGATHADPEPLRGYREALEALRAGHHADALAGFSRFLRLHPQHDYADNAQYWIGECFYDVRQFAAAEREFRRVIERYPHGNKVPDAMLKLGFSLHFLGDPEGSRAVLESLTRAFPKHEAAVLASAQLAHPDLDPGPSLSITPASLGR